MTIVFGMCCDLTYHPWIPFALDCFPCWGFTSPISMDSSSVGACFLVTPLLSRYMKYNISCIVPKAEPTPLGTWKSIHEWWIWVYSTALAIINMKLCTSRVAKWVDQAGPTQSIGSSKKNGLDWGSSYSIWTSCFEVHLGPMVHQIDLIFFFIFKKFIQI